MVSFIETYRFYFVVVYFPKINQHVKIHFYTRTWFSGENINWIN